MVIIIIIQIDVLIPETSKDGTRFLSENYGGFESEPSIHYKGIPYEYNYLGDPRIGTEEGLYKELFSENQTIFNIATIANQFVLNYASEIKTNVSIDAYLGSSTATAIASIDAGHPIILGYNGISGTKTFHVVVAYGYATVYGEMGFIVHYGHDDDKTQIWVPASWFGFQIRMTVAHEHEYELEYQQSDKFFEDTYTEFHCVSCKHKKYDKLFTVNESGETITGLRYPHITWLKIPTIYNGNYITKIGDGAFAHSDIGLVAFDFNSNITTIGNRAFEDCKSLNLANIPDKVTSIGNYAFAGIDSLLIKFSNPSLQTIGHNAFFETALVMSEFPASVKKIDNKAFCKSDLGTDFLLPANSQLTTIDYSAFDTNLRLKYFFLPKTISSIAKNAFQNCPSISFYTENSSKPTGWNEEWNLSRPVIWGCTLSSDKSYVVSFTKTNMNPSNANAQNGIFNPIRKDYTFGGWYTSLNFSGTQYMDINSAPNGTLFAKWEQKSCVAEGTLITLADGTQKAVEDLTGDEQLLVWNLFTGTFDTAPILFIDHDPSRQFEVVNLTFSDGTVVKVIDEHGFWDFDLNRYVFLRHDAAQYLGHWFQQQIFDENGDLTYRKVQLVGVTTQTEYTSAWSPVTYGHLSYYVNGMLSMPGATTGLINIFDVDSQTLKIDEAAYFADVTEYGLFTYEEFSARFPIPEFIFDAFGGRYLKVAMGKGLLSEEMMINLMERYSEFFSA